MTHHVRHDSIHSNTNVRHDSIRSNNSGFGIGLGGAGNGYEGSLGDSSHRSSPTSPPSLPSSPPSDLDSTPSGMDGSAPNHLELFVRAGRDGESLGGCPLCQRLFIILLLKAKGGSLTFTVTTVNISKPPPDFKRISSRLPALVHGDETLSDPDEMIQYLDEKFPYPPLAYANVNANQVCLDVFSKFSFYIKDVSHSPGPLLTELYRLSAYLDESPYRFLCRSELPDHLDCIMLPKLQHIRVVAKAFKDFDIPEDCRGLWAYLASAYSSDFFRQTCPTDQEILYHWMSKPECAALSKAKQIQYSPQSKPVYSFDVPTSASR